MGKSGGFLDFGRVVPGYRKAGERVKDYRPVEQRLGEANLRAQAARCMDCGTPFCHGAGCPLGNVVPEMNDMVYQGRWREAFDILMSTHRFADFTAYLCPAPCERACVLDINDDPVTIRQIEMAIIEKAYAKGYMRPTPPKQRLPQSVAVVGSGPAGLAVADYLNQMGYGVTIYDKAQAAGGILRYGIPDFKLDKTVVQRRLQVMEDEGVVFELGVSVGDDVSFKFLSDRHDAVCIAGGAQEPRDLALPGRELAGIDFAMTFLVRQNRVNAGEDVSDMPELTAAGKRVLIIGGGDTGSDCVGTSIRQKAEHVMQFEILPKPPEARPESTPWPSWPNELRSSSSHEEGGERRWSVSTKAFLGKDGVVTGVRGVEVEWTVDENGRHVFEEKPDTEFEEPVDLVLFAMGFVGPGKNPWLDDLDVVRNERGNIQVDDRHMTSVAGLFAAGDMATGQSLIVRALADGRNAASGIDAYLENLRR